MSGIIYAICVGARLLGEAVESGAVSGGECGAGSEVAVVLLEVLVVLMEVR